MRWTERHGSVNNKKSKSDASDSSGNCIKERGCVLSIIWAIRNSHCMIKTVPGILKWTFHPVLRGLIPFYKRRWKKKKNSNEKDLQLLGMFTMKWSRKVGKMMLDACIECYGCRINVLWYRIHVQINESIGGCQWIQQLFPGDCKEIRIQREVENEKDLHKIMSVLWSEIIPMKSVSILVKYFAK